MDSLYDILANKDFSAPDEVTAIKTFVAERYKADVSVSVTTRDIVVSSRNAALISTLRMNAPALAKAVGTDKKLRFKVA